MYHSTVCPAGTYTQTAQPHFDLTLTCKNCPIGLFIADDGIDETQHESVDSCLTCPKGYETKDVTECQVCGFSKYQNRTDVQNVQCTTCPTNTYIADDRQEDVAHDTVADCIPCSFGKYTLVDGDRACDTCLRGKVKTGSTCVSCLSGTFQNKSLCSTCPAGFSSDVESTKCRSCEAGTYGVGCQQCDAGQYRTKCNEANCTGVEDIFPTSCTHCPIGFSQSDLGQASCTKCSRGEFNDDVGAAACKLCAANTFYGDKGRGPPCVACPTGWLAEEGSAKCTRCGSGTFGDGCQNCAKGQYRPSKYTNGSDTDPTTCIDCQIGQFMPDQGAAKCVDCIPGQFQDEKGNQKCKECPKDTFAASSKEIGKKNTKEEKKKRNRLAFVCYGGGAVVSCCGVEVVALV